MCDLKEKLVKEAKALQIEVAQAETLRIALFKADAEVK
jgi:hypothetical protein